jgi:predicted MFS family arabinose efflux permease
MLQALVLTWLTWRGLVTPAWLIGLALVLGTINALDLPARQAFSAQLVDKREDLPNAIALNSLLMNSARFVGPALAGFAVATIGEAWCFAINAASYLAVMLALLAIRVSAASRRAGARPGRPFAPASPTSGAIRRSGRGC